MKKIKSADRLLLESGFSRKEINEIKRNAKILKIDLVASVKDIGKRTIRATFIVGMVLTIFTVGTSIKSGLSSFGIIIFLFSAIAVFSYFLTPMKLYIKSAFFFAKGKRDER